MYCFEYYVYKALIDNGFEFDFINNRFTKGDIEISNIEYDCYCFIELNIKETIKLTGTSEVFSDTGYFFDLGITKEDNQFNIDETGIISFRVERDKMLLVLKILTPETLKEYKEKYSQENKFFICAHHNMGIDEEYYFRDFVNKNEMYGMEIMLDAINYSNENNPSNVYYYIFPLDSNFNPENNDYSKEDYEYDYRGIDDDNNDEEDEDEEEDENRKNLTLHYKCKDGSGWLEYNLYFNPNHSIFSSQDFLNGMKKALEFSEGSAEDLEIA